MLILALGIKFSDNFLNGRKKKYESEFNLY